MWHLRLRRPTYTVGPHVHNGVFYVLLLGCFRQPTFSCNLVRVWIVCPQHEKKTKNSKITNISSECYKFHVLWKKIGENMMWFQYGKTIRSFNIVIIFWSHLRFNQVKEQTNSIFHRRIMRKFNRFHHYLIITWGTSPVDQQLQLLLFLNKFLLLLSFNVNLYSCRMFLFDFKFSCTTCMLYKV